MALKNGRSSSDLTIALAGSVIPPGTIAPFGGGTVPTGWLLCDGSTVSRTTYSALFTAVKVSGTPVHGIGDGTTTFHLPDYRGYHLRGADNMGTGAAGRDPDAGTRTAPNTGGATGAGVGSIQSDSVVSHAHTARMSNNFGGNTDSFVASNGSSGGNNGTSGGTGVINTSSVGANETRGKNVNVNYIIKY